MKKTTYSPLYRTKDQFIASTLYALGFKLDSSEWVDGACFFIFEDDKKCKQLVSNYFRGELRIDPRDLWEAFKTIKSIIFN